MREYQAKHKYPFIVGIDFNAPYSISCQKNLDLLEDCWASCSLFWRSAALLRQLPEIRVAAQVLWSETVMTFFLLLATVGMNRSWRMGNRSWNSLTVEQELRSL
jgi:hypothetical protein